MKLFAKTSLFYLLAGIPVLAIAGFVCYWMISTEVQERNREELDKQRELIEEYLQEGDTTAVKYFINSGETSIEKIKQEQNAQKSVFGDTLIYNAEEREYDLSHFLSCVIQTEENDFKVRIWRKTLETDEFMEGLFAALFIIVFFLFLIFFLINWWISNTLWKPFYTTVETLQSFRASDTKKPLLQTTTVKEFAELNKSADAMMDKMIVDFNSQKQFTENASHEMQTPLAVIRAKIDLLIQSEKLGQKESDLILSIDAACAKLGRLNKSLLLLTKIENRQFKLVEQVSLNKVIADSLDFFAQNIETKKITVVKDILPEISTRINPDLCFVLINNILQNGIRHNIQNGSIEIKLEAGKLTVSNTGQPMPMETSKLFERFQKSATSTESLGLGLAIVKEIADASDLVLNYQYELGKHHFILSFIKEE